MAHTPCAPLSPPDSWWGPDTPEAAPVYHVFTPDFTHEDWLYTPEDADAFAATLRAQNLTPQVETFA